jgi:hypothetical protein
VHCVFCSAINDVLNLNYLLSFMFCLCFSFVRRKNNCLCKGSLSPEFLLGLGVAVLFFLRPKWPEKAARVLADTGGGYVEIK